MNLLFFALTTSLGIYILFVLFFLTGLRRIKVNEKNITSWPTVAIVIAARNEETNLPNIFQDLAQLDYPKELLDIVIVDDRSTDNTWSLIKHFSDQHAHIHGVLIKEKSPAMTPKKYALTTAIEQSKESIFCQQMLIAVYHKAGLKVWLSCWKTVLALLLVRPLLKAVNIHPLFIINLWIFWL